MTIPEYLANVEKRFQSGIAREHAYRPDLQQLLSTLLPGVDVINEPARVACGAPDYVLNRKDVPVGYIEAKDIGVDLGSKALKEQFDRYKAGLSNLIFTDYLDFHFYKDGVLTAKIAIATYDAAAHTITPLPAHFEQFTGLIKNFAQTVTQTIKSPTKLAQMMAGKAKLMADIIFQALEHDDLKVSRTGLQSQMLAFQQMLIHDIDNKAFADIYAQTIAYGMFAARYHDPTLPTFSREEAATLIPKSNPFLRKLFQDIAGYDLDDRLVWIVDELVRIFLASDVAQIMKDFGKSTKQEDPVVHFYETFLAEYNPALRKARGVWYTPQPVVNFIVRAVDDILKTEFNLPQGLADTSKTKIKVRAHKFDNRSKGKSKITGEQDIEREVHKVQILDPATGTGTFLAEVVRHIHKKFAGQEGIWGQYVEDHLIPRLNGFELLMASYAMAHLKMDMLLTETGYKPTGDQRFRIFLTNSLEEPTDVQFDLFNWLSDEANQANAVKRDTPVMVVLGNPPYSVSSSNKSPWILNLISDYKKNLNERKINLDDDYIKFIRYGQHFIDKNGSGVLAYISNNSFIDGITHRQMRKSLLESFDKIYILDLHGNAKKKETAPDGSIDQNVFDIMQGVSINIFIKTTSNFSSEAKIFHFDLFGRRESKYKTLSENKVLTIKWKEVNCNAPNYFFVPKNFSGQNIYESGFLISELFKTFSIGLETQNDEITIHHEQVGLETVLSNFKSMDVAGLKSKYSLKDGRDWTATTAKQDIISNHNVTKINYRPFDYRFTSYSGKSKGFHAYPRYDSLRHLLNLNIALCCVKLNRKFEQSTFFVSNSITDKSVISSLDNSSIFPLYLYPENTQQTTTEALTRTPNLNPKIVQDIASKMGLRFTPEKESDPGTFAPIDLLDYIYAVLHSPSYRETYKEFLKIDFPRVPYPEDANEFWRLVALGGQLRSIHLLESPAVEQFITKYPVGGHNTVEKPVYKDGRVYINDDQYFDNVPQTAWEFYIGGYQPAQKWLKDRKGRTLSLDDVFHYQKIIVALDRTKALMEEIDVK